MARASSADKILEHAAQFFAKKGFTGTIMDELAESAGVNKATIYYHFKDKRRLYEAVLLHHMKPMADAILESVAQQHSALDKLNAYITTFAKENGSRPHMTSILMREVAGGGDNMPDTTKAQMYRILTTIKAIIVQGVQEGIFVNVSPLVIHFMVIGSLSFYITSEPIRKAMVSNDPQMQNDFVNSTVEDVALQLSQMVQNALLTKENR